MASHRIQPASGASLPACFALLAKLAHPDAVVFEARDEAGVLAGAGGLIWRSWGDPPGMAAWIEVLPDRRRQGVGRRLLAALAAEAATEPLDLVAISTLEDGSAGAAFAHACGATEDARQFYYQGQPRRFAGNIDPLLARLAARGRVPDAARVVTLAEAPVDDVKWLVANEMASAPPLIEQMLSESRDAPADRAAIDWRQSCVLMHGDEVAGALLSRRLPEPGRAAIVCNVTAPAWRGGWANALLLERFTRLAIEEGTERFAFDCREDVRDTIGLARRCGADLVAVKSRFRYAAAATPDRRR